MVFDGNERGYIGKGIKEELFKKQKGKCSPERIPKPRVVSSQERLKVGQSLYS